MSGDTTTIQLLREACAAGRAAAPSETGAWSRFEAGRRRAAVTTRIAAGFAFAAILAAAIALAGVAGRLGRGAVAPAAGGLVAPTTVLEPSASTPGPAAQDHSLEPVGAVLEVASGSVAGHPWSYELFRNGRGEVCTRWGDDLAPGSCGTGSDPMTGVNPVAAYDGGPGRPRHQRALPAAAAGQGWRPVRPGGLRDRAARHRHGDPHHRLRRRGAGRARRHQPVQHARALAGKIVRWRARPADERACDEDCGWQGSC